MAQQFAGLCVGGPMAGLSMVNDTRKLVVETRPPVSFDLNTLVPAPGDTFTITTMFYNWHHTGALGLWIPDGMSLHDAIETMAQAYLEKCNAARR